MKKVVHFEHCPGCSDPLCKVISDAKVTDKKSKVTCEKCRKLLNGPKKSKQ